MAGGGHATVAACACAVSASSKSTRGTRGRAVLQATSCMAESHANKIWETCAATCVPPPGMRAVRASSGAGGAAAALCRARAPGAPIGALVPHPAPSPPPARPLDASRASRASSAGSSARSLQQRQRPAARATTTTAATPPPTMGGTKFTSKSVYDLGKKELKSRAEAKLDGGLKVGCNFSDHSSLVSVDAERGAFKLGYDLQRDDAVFQYTRKQSTGTFKIRQVVPNMHWEVVPSPVVELSTKLLDNSKFKDSLKLVYDFSNRFAYYTETLKYQKKFKVRVAGDSKSTDTALCLGYKPDKRWVKSVKLVQTPSTGPLLSYKLKPVDGWKIATEASLRSKTLAGSVTYKAQKGDTELVLDAAVPLPGNAGKVKLLRKAGVKVDFKF